MGNFNVSQSIKSKEPIIKDAKYIQYEKGEGIFLGIKKMRLNEFATGMSQEM